MAQVKKTVLIHHSAAEMFMLVDDVLKYPEFLPWCGGVDLLTQNDSTTVATLHIDYHGLRQNFTTENSKHYPNSMIIQLKDGPFKHLDGHWQFHALNDEACKSNSHSIMNFPARFWRRSLHRYSAILPIHL